MRAWDAAVAAVALRTARPRDDATPDPRTRLLAPAVDDPGAALANRGALDQTRAALIASLWPAPSRQCVAAPVYVQYDAPAVFGLLNVVRRRSRMPQAPGARALLTRLETALGARWADEKPAAAAESIAA